ncbi:hypothetical protein [Spiroplasma sp. SV19]|uniref:hypothetical protein n=1 Tax=Spiroplasma sp. SV19 TaxID=2570468 RepID=UPI0024B76605|nr:hypothetical protein [Spiroplasma sp. SV19]WHQ37365.1 hypothetical protein E7Y35_05810 [Spiroplasma sp. SV19]
MISWYELLSSAFNFFKKNFILEKYIKSGSIDQGKYNGPDFIFKNTVTSYTIGFEITEYAKLFYDVSDIRNKDNFIKTIDKKITKLMDSDFDKKMQYLGEIINKKVIKISNYINTDEIKLGIIMNHQILPHEYFHFEFWINFVVNSYKGSKKAFNEIYIL